MLCKRPLTLEEHQIPRFLTGQPHYDQIPHSGDPLDLANYWIRSCKRDHGSECAGHIGGDLCLPTRLIDVGTSKHPREPRLWLTSESSLPVPYIALSHRWAKSEQILLTEDSLSLLQKKIPISKIPRSHGDAIHVAQYLGIQYLVCLLILY